jgi:hypothetical protein
MNMIDIEPDGLAIEIDASIAAVNPAAGVIPGLQRQLLARHAALHLKPTISSEEVVEGLVRCRLTHHLQQKFELRVDSIPACVNSSHKAVRRVCVDASRHSHGGISDKAWSAAWQRLQQEHPGVNVRVAGRSAPRRADLYIVARGRIVSLEFKYIGEQGLRDAAACAAQVGRHAANHALAFLVVYCGAGAEVLDDAMARLRRLVSGGNVRVAGMHGPVIPVARSLEKTG